MYNVIFMGFGQISPLKGESFFVVQMHQIEVFTKLDFQRLDLRLVSFLLQFHVVFQFKVSAVQDQLNFSHSLAQ
jgi:hypothetical protein